MDGIGLMKFDRFLQCFEKSLIESFGPRKTSLGDTILKLSPYLFVPYIFYKLLDLSVFMSLRVRWEQDLTNWQKHNEEIQLIDSQNMERN